MTAIDKILSRLSLIKRYHYKWSFYLAIAWTIVDILYWSGRIGASWIKSDTRMHIITTEAILLRAVIVLVSTSTIIYYLIFKLRETFRNWPVISYYLIKTILLILASVLMNFLLNFSYVIVIYRETIERSFELFKYHTQSPLWLFEHSIGWAVLFILSHILVEINEKYSPGIFWQILTGKYIQPKIEYRIVMFVDMQDSTEIAEKLGSKKYFMFLRDFIYFLSIALLEFDGRIYQYVGDEIVVSWPRNKDNCRRCIASLMYAERLFNKNKTYFLRKYGHLPKYKAGIHAGQVTVGEIGIIKKDLVLSGDTMNTAARIRDTCREFERSYMASKDFISIGCEKYNFEPVGDVNLKGKDNSVELFILNI